MTNRETLGKVMNALQEEGYIEGDPFIDSKRLNTSNELPWFIQGLMGCGGWVAALFMLGVIGSCIATFLINLDETGIGVFLLIIGSIFVGATTASERDADNGVFATQLMLTIHVAGHILVVGGAVFTFSLWQTDTTLVIALMFTIILQMVFIYLYPNAIYRFIAMLVIAYALGGIAFIYEMPILISIFTGIFMIIAILVWGDKLPDRWQIQYQPILQPIGYGAIVGAFGFMTYEVSNRYAYYYGDIPPDTTIITTFLLFACLIVVEYQLLREYDVDQKSPFALMVFGITALIALPVYSTPGILAGVIGIFLAFRRRNRILLGISYLYLAGFIGYYYYWLDVTLLTKSIILMVTGALLIMARLLLRHLVTVPDVLEGENS